jgi:ABC-type Fe3+/spermidine/putrescine transport system ATPase subunit
MLLSIQGITKRFGDELALAGVSFDVGEGEVVCLLGPSGCGKTTLLRIVAGLETADDGQILLDGQDIGPVPPHRRDFGLMFQDYALFPHKNVFDNVAFGMRMKRMGENEIRQQVSEVLTLVGLGGFEQRSVNELSGGEAQRVALARSLATRPRLLMLDEPLGSLDRALRERLMTELCDILTEVGVTALYVTHDQAEAFAIADRAVVMNTGRVEQIGPPEMIYRCPATPFVAHFLGLTNLAQGLILDHGLVASAWGDVRVDTGDHVVGEKVNVLIRPEAAKFAAEDPLMGKGNVIRGKLTMRSFRGGRYRVRVQPDTGPPLDFELAAIGELPVRPGSRVTIELDPGGIALLPAMESHKVRRIS